MKFSYKNNDINPSRFEYNSTKLLIVVLCCFTIAGNFYCYEIPQQIEQISPTLFRFKFSLFSEKDLNDFLTFYNLYYVIPSFIFPIIGGYLILMIGYKKIIIFFGIFSLLGQFTQIIAFIIHNISLFYMGRVVFCFGCENLTIGILVLLCNWISRNKLGITFAVLIAFSRIFNFFSLLNTSLILYYNRDTIDSMWIGFAIESFSVIMLFFVLYLDFKKDVLSQIKEVYNAKILNSFNLEPKITTEINTQITYLNFNACLFFGIFLYLNKQIFEKDKSDETTFFIGGNIALFAQFLLSTLLIPLFGFISDKLGKRAYFIVFSNVFLLISLFIFNFCNDKDNDIILGVVLILSSISYSIFSSIFLSTISFISPLNNLPTYLGFSVSFQNVGSVFIPMISFRKAWIIYLSLISIILINTYLLIKKKLDFERNDELNSDFNIESNSNNSMDENENQSIINQIKNIKNREKEKEEGEFEEILKILNDKEYF